MKLLNVEFSPSAYKLSFLSPIIVLYVEYNFKFHW